MSSRGAEAPQRYYEEGREYSAKEDVNLGGSGALDRGCANFAFTEFSEVRASKESGSNRRGPKKGSLIRIAKNSVGQRVVETHLPALHNKVGQLPEIALS